MRHPLRKFLLLATMLLLATVPATSSGGDLPREITSAYRPAVERLNQAYTSVSIEGTTSMVQPRQDKSLEQRFVMRADGTLRRLDLEATAQSGMGVSVGSKEMRMATPYGSLVSVTAPGSESFDDARQTSYADTVSKIDNGCLMNYPYALDSTGNILDMLLSPAVKVTGVRRFTSDGETLIEIKYQQQGRFAERTGVWNSSLVLSPSESWALRGFTRTTGEGANRITQRAKITYSGMEDGVPLIQSIETETVENGRAMRREAIQVAKIKFGPPDNYFFTSFAY